MYSEAPENESRTTSPGARHPRVGATQLSGSDAILWLWLWQPQQSKSAKMENRKTQPKGLRWGAVQGLGSIMGSVIFERQPLIQRLMLLIYRVSPKTRMWLNFMSEG